MSLTRTGETSKVYPSEKEANRRAFNLAIAHPEHRFWRTGCTIHVALNETKRGHNKFSDKI